MHSISALIATLRAPLLSCIQVHMFSLAQVWQVRLKGDAPERFKREFVRRRSFARRNKGFPGRVVAANKGFHQWRRVRSGRAT